MIQTSNAASQVIATLTNRIGHQPTYFEHPTQKCQANQGFSRCLNSSGTFTHTVLKGQYLTSCQFSQVYYHLESNHARYIWRIVILMEIRLFERYAGVFGVPDDRVRPSWSPRGSNPPPLPEFSGLLPTAFALGTIPRPR